MQGHFSLGRKKNDFVNGVIEVCRDIQRLHITHPASTTGMNGIPNLVLAFQDQRAHSLFRRHFTGSQARGTTAHNQYIPIFWHEQPSLSYLRSEKVEIIWYATKHTRAFLSFLELYHFTCSCCLLPGTFRFSQQHFLSYRKVFTLDQLRCSGSVSSRTAASSSVWGV